MRTIEHYFAERNVNLMLIGPILFIHASELLYVRLFNQAFLTLVLLGFGDYLYFAFILINLIESLVEELVLITQMTAFLDLQPVEIIHQSVLFGLGGSFRAEVPYLVIIGSCIYSFYRYLYILPLSKPFRRGLIPQTYLNFLLIEPNDMGAPLNLSIPLIN